MCRSSPIRGTWIEIPWLVEYGDIRRRSSPIRGTWIEIEAVVQYYYEVSAVVPHTGDVDRNYQPSYFIVANPLVVPHTGDVDRNQKAVAQVKPTVPSSPIRGTWIEICRLPPQVRRALSSPIRGTWIEIAIPMGGLDYCQWSSPIRGTWIEIHDDHKYET